MKRFFYILAMVLLCVVLIIAMLLMLVQSSKVQTAVLEVVTHKVSENLNTRIDIEKIAYSFPNRLTINGIYIEDEQQDTLLWVDTLQARFEATGFFHKRIIFSKATLKHVYANAYTIDPSKETSRMNYDFLLDLLPEQQSDSSQMQEVVEVKNVSLRDVRLRYDDWRVRDMEADLALNRLSSDSLDAEVNHLSLTLNDAFFIKELQTRAILTEDKAQIRNLLVSLPNSTLSLYGSVEHSYRAAENDSVAQSGNMFTRLFNLQRLETAQANLKIRTASITPSDIALFVPALKNIKGQTMFNTTVTGTIGDIFIDDLEFDYKGTRILSGDVSVRGLPDIKSAFINAELLDLALDYALIQDFVSDLKGKPFFLPQEVARLGRMHYSGILKGRQDSLVLNGLFASGLGNISTDGYLLTDTTDQQMTFRGIVATPRFNLGRMLGQKDIGSLAMRAQLDGKVGEKQPLEAKLNAIVQSFQLKGYTYRNATIEGMYRKNDFEGQISIADDNIAFDFDGLVDMTGEVPVANFDLVLHHLRLAELNLTNKYADMDISAKMVMNASGDNLDNFNGYLAIDSLYLQRAEKELLMRQLYITAESGNEQERTSLKINSDFLNASFSGYYKYSQIPLAIERLVAKHTPQMLSLKTRKKLEQTPAGNDMIYYLYFKNLDSICQVLDLPLSIGKMPTIKGFIDERKEQFAVQAIVPTVRYGKMNIDNITLNFDNRQNQLNLNLYLYNHAGKSIAAKRIGDIELRLDSYAKRDSLYLTFGFESKDSIRHEGKIRLRTHFAQYAGMPLVDVQVVPSTITISDKSWTVDDSHLIYAAADTSIQINAFRIGNDENFIYADGLASRRDNDSVYVELHEIVVDPLLDYTNVKKSITFGGAVTGWAKAFAVLKAPAFEADVRMNDAQINNTVMGDVHGMAWLDRRDMTIGIWGALVDGGDTVATVDGLVEPKDNRWGINIYPDSANLAFINGWTKGIIEGIEGRGFGWVHVFGEGKLTWVEGQACAKHASVMIPMLGTRYYLSDTVSMELESILFNNIRMHDAEGNPLVLNGRLDHENFKNFKYDLSMQCRQAQVMNLKEDPKAMFYGNVYATANLRIRGDEEECRIFADATTAKNSTFTFSLGTASNARDNTGFIQFVDHSILPQKTTDDDESTAAKKRATKVLLNLQIAATRDALINLMIDPRTGDKLSARGEGNIRVQYDVNQDDIKMFGTYALQQGSFSFTLENLIRKEFSIRDGSTVLFTGDPLACQISASAQYTTTASLRDLFGEDVASMNLSGTSVPVNCIIYLSGNLTNPTVSFGIELPQADEGLASQVRSVINTDEMMMREVLYLLVFNKFYTPEYLQSNNTSGLGETYSLLTSTISGQINNWLRRLTNNFTIGFNIRHDIDSDENTQEYETEFQYQPNNRLLINGNFGYRHNDISNQPIFGNLDVEYMLSPSGMWRAKAYTHMVDKYSLKNAHTIQGVGFMFKYDFNSVTKEEKEKKKQQKQEQMQEQKKEQKEQKEQNEQKKQND